MLQFKLDLDGEAEWDDKRVVSFVHEWSESKVSSKSRAEAAIAYIPAIIYYCLTQRVLFVPEHEKSDESIFFRYLLKGIVTLPKHSISYQDVIDDAVMHQSCSKSDDFLMLNNCDRRAPQV